MPWPSTGSGGGENIGASASCLATTADAQLRSLPHVPPHVPPLYGCMPAYRSAAPDLPQYPGKKEVKGKRQQAVAVCVLEVICTKQGQLQQQPASNRAARGPRPAVVGGASSGPVVAPVEAAAAAGAAAGPRKRQRTMDDFMMMVGQGRRMRV